MSRSGSLYIQRESIFHQLDGSVKLLMLLAWTGFVFLFLDARVFLIMTMVGFGMLVLSKLPFKTIKPLVLFVVIFTIFNSLFLLLITPQYGSTLTGTYTEVFSLAGYRLTYETLWYAVTLSLKYIAILPITLLFLFTTNPSSFASSLNRLGISYKVAYAVNIALRYIPDVKKEVKHIIDAQEARGVAFKRGDAGLWQRLRNYGTVLLPLLISSLNRVEIVSNAMDLRGFGRGKRRTWYYRKALSGQDVIFSGLAVLLFCLGLYLRNEVFQGFWCF